MCGGFDLQLEVHLVTSQPQTDVSNTTFLLGNFVFPGSTSSSSGMDDLCFISTEQTGSLLCGCCGAKFCLLKWFENVTVYNRLFVVVTDSSPLMFDKLQPESIPLPLISIPMFTLLILTNPSNQQHSAVAPSDNY